MSIKPRIAINLVAILALTVVTVGWAMIKLVAPTFINKPFKVTADFASSGGVFTNQEVTYRGVLIGKVGELTLNEDGVFIELMIDPEWENEIPDNSIAKVQSKSAVGEQFVNLVPPRSGSNEMLADDDEIPREQTQLPVDFQLLLRTLDAVLADVPPEKTKNLIHNLARGLEGRADEIAVILESLGTLSETFASVAPEQQRLLDNSTVAGKAFLDSKEEFADALKATDRVLAGLGDEPAELRRLFVQNDRLARQGLRLIARNGDDLQDGFDALADFIDYQLATRDVIDDSLDYVPAFLHAIEDASIPWRDPNGDEYYRIRAGLVVDNVESTWPCKYDLPVNFHRYPHQRDLKELVVFPELECRPSSTPITGSSAETTQSSQDSFFEALRILLAEKAGRGEIPDRLKSSGDIDYPTGWLDPPEEEEPDPEPSSDPEPSAEPSPEPSPEPSSDGSPSPEPAE